MYEVIQSWQNQEWHGLHCRFAQNFCDIFEFPFTDIMWLSCKFYFCDKSWKNHGDRCCLVYVYRSLHTSNYFYTLETRACYPSINSKESVLYLEETTYEMFLGDFSSLILDNPVKSKFILLNKFDPVGFPGLRLIMWLLHAKIML